MFKQAPALSTSFTVTEDGFPVGNRPQYSDAEREFTKVLIPSGGVPINPSDNLEVTAAGGMDVSVAKGVVIKNGMRCYLDTAKTISLTTSASDQVIYIGIRMAAGDTHVDGDDVLAYTTFVQATDCAVARINIPANATTITSGMITNLRGNPAYCPFANDLITQAEEAIAAFNENGIVQHASTHAAGGDDELTGFLATSAATYSDAVQAATRENISAAKAVSGVADAIEAAVVINAQTDNYTAALSDLGKDIWITNSSNKTLTIPLQSSVTWVDKSYFFVTRGGAGTLTIAGASGVTVNSAGSRLKVAEQYGTVMIRRTAENVWLVTGATGV